MRACRLMLPRGAPQSTADLANSSHLSACRSGRFAHLRRRNKSVHARPAKAVSHMTKILVDGVEVDVPPELTLLQACEAAGAEIPRFCYHERLSIAGNCRMCLIEVKVGGKSGPKPIASCAQQVKDLPPPRDDKLNELVTKSAAVKKRAQRRDGVPAHQSPARLPDLRPGRRVRPARPVGGLRPRRLALR